MAIFKDKVYIEDELKIEFTNSIKWYRQYILYDGQKCVEKKDLCC